ncbi:MAG: hypothetical protein QXT28_12245 [Thermofilaceae archaeon]
MARKRSSRWIQEAIKRPGALREWLKENRGRVKRLTGEDPFDRKGRIKVRVLRKLLAKHKKGRVRLHPRTVKRIQLALTLHKLRK